MDSIRTHYAIHGAAAISPSKAKQQQPEREVHAEPSKGDDDYANKPVETPTSTDARLDSPSKRTGKAALTAAPKRRKTDAMGTKVELKSSGSKYNLNDMLKASDSVKEKPAPPSQGTPKRPVAAVRTPNKTRPASRLERPLPRTPSRAESLSKASSTTSRPSLPANAKSEIASARSSIRSESTMPRTHSTSQMRYGTEDRQARHQPPPANVSRSSSSMSAARHNSSGLSSSRSTSHASSSSRPLPQVPQPHSTSGTSATSHADTTSARSFSRSQSVSRLPTATPSSASSQRSMSTSSSSSERPPSTILSSSASLRNLKVRSMIPRSTSITSSLKDVPESKLPSSASSRTVSAASRLQLQHQQQARREGEATQRRVVSNDDSMFPSGPKSETRSRHED